MKPTFGRLFLFGFMLTGNIRCDEVEGERRCKISRSYARSHPRDTRYRKDIESCCQPKPTADSPNCLDTKRCQRFMDRAKNKPAQLKEVETCCKPTITTSTYKCINAYRAKYRGMRADDIGSAANETFPETMCRSSMKRAIRRGRKQAVEDAKSCCEPKPTENSPKCLDEKRCQRYYVKCKGEAALIKQLDVCCKPSVNDKTYACISAFRNNNGRKLWWGSGSTTANSTGAANDTSTEDDTN